MPKARRLAITLTRVSKSNLSITSRAASENAAMYAFTAIVGGIVEELRHRQRGASIRLAP
jgi:hypothetical protein